MSVYTGFYINLDRSTQRRAEIESELKKFGLETVYKRFPALDGSTLTYPKARIAPGAVGCFASHMQLLAQNIGSVTHLHVVEDDTVFSAHTKKAIEDVIASGIIEHYDIVYLDLFVPLKNDAYRSYRQAYERALERDAAGKPVGVRFRMLDLAGMEFAATSSMLINRNAIAKLHAICTAEMEAGPREPIDLALLRKFRDGGLKVGCLFPFVTSIRPAQFVQSNIDSTQAEGAGAVPWLPQSLVRHSFFIGADWNALLNFARQHLPLPEQQDAQMQLMNHLLAFSLTGAYKTF